MVTSCFGLELIINPPDFQAERTYLRTEKAYVRRHISSVKGKWWAGVSIPTLGKIGHKEWHAYSRELEKYEHALLRLEKEVDDGLTPAFIDVANLTDRTLRDIRVEVKVKHGTIHKDTRPPERPKRIDGAPDKPSPTAFHGFHGFTRRNIKIERNSFSAEFSSLKPGDSALVIIRELYIRVNPDTKLDYEISARGMSAPEAGTYSFAIE